MANPRPKSKKQRKKVQRNGKRPRWLDYMALDGIEGAKKNPKLHHTDISTSVSRFGYADAMILDERTSRLVAGHGRREELLRAKAAGEAPPDGIEVDGDGNWLVPVQRGWSSKDDDEAAAFLVAHNRLVEAGGWDDESFAEILEGLSEDRLEGLGWNSAEIELLLDGDNFEPLPPVSDEEGATRKEYGTIKIRFGNPKAVIAASKKIRSLLEKNEKWQAEIVQAE